MNLIKKISISLLIVMVSSFTLFGVELVDLRQDGQAYIQQFDNSIMTVNSAEILGLTADSQLEQITRIDGENGNVHIRSYQLYKGVPVYGEQVILSENADGQVYQLHGRVARGIEQDVVNVEPAFTKEQALAMVKAQNVPYGVTSELEYANEESQLFIYIDQDNVARLAYVVSYFVDSLDGEPSRPYFVIDAETGVVIDQWEGLTHQKVGTGPGGNQRVGRYEYGTTYGYMDVRVSGSTYTMENANVKTIDLKHGTTGYNAYSYQGPRNTHKTINGAYSPLNDAHYFGGVTYDMFKDYAGVPPLNFQLVLKVHYKTNYENAFWNGREMTFGDGASRFHPLVCLGVVAHEVAHGFTQNNSNLAYRNQSGGINESYSDFASEAAQYYMKGSCDYLIGSEIKKGSGAMRYMDDPTRDGRSIGHVRDYRAGMDVHHSSGVYNKVFYLASTAPGMDPKKVFQVFTKANQRYWTANETFQSAALDTMDACKDLGYSQRAFYNAFKAVGIDVPIIDDNKLPIVTIATDKQKYKVGETIRITATARDEDGRVVKVEFLKGTSTLHTDTTAPYSYNITNAQKGTYKLVAKATDDKDGVGEATVTVVVGDGDIPPGDAWKPGVAYSVGAVVTHNGSKWLCTFAHTSNSAWYPGAPGLWFWKQQ